MSEYEFVKAIEERHLFWVIWRDMWGGVVLGRDVVLLRTSWSCFPRCLRKMVRIMFVVALVVLLLNIV